MSIHDTGQPAVMSEEARVERIDALLAEMTVEEKAGQLTQYFYFGFLREVCATGNDADPHQPSKPDMVEAALAQGGDGSLSVSVEVINAGDHSGDEVVQLYIHQRHGRATRPVRELKGFQRITLAAGERQTIAFTLGPDELRYWHALERDWVIDAATARQLSVPRLRSQNRKYADRAVTFPEIANPRS